MRKGNTARVLPLRIVLSELKFVSSKALSFACFILSFGILRVNTGVTTLPVFQ